jgi:hypothetical protein
MLRIPNIEAADRSVVDFEEVTHHVVQKEAALKIVHDLVDLDDDLAIRPLGKAHRLHMRINHLPLASPVAANGLPPMEVPPFQPVGPYDILMQSGEHGIDVARVKPVVKEIQELDLILHCHLRSPRPS